MSASGQASQLLRLGTPLVQPISAPPPAPPALTLLLYRLRIGSGDVLTFYDGDDLTARVLGQYSGPRGHFKLFTSMADVTIQFQSDPGTSVLGYQQGFVIHFFGEFVLSDLDCRPPNHDKSNGAGQQRVWMPYQTRGTWEGAMYHQEPLVTSRKL